MYGDIKEFGRSRESGGYDKGTHTHTVWSVLQESAVLFHTCASFKNTLTARKLRLKQRVHAFGQLLSATLCIKMNNYRLGNTQLKTMKRETYLLTEVSVLGTSNLTKK
jgi:hypothetical protein